MTSSPGGGDAGSDRAGGAMAIRGWRVCDACGLAVDALEDAGLAVDPQALREHEDALSEWESRLAAGEEGRPPDLVQWDWGHRDCYPNSRNEHWIPGEQVATLPGLVAWTLLLMDLEWVRLTAWDDAVRRFYDIPFLDAPDWLPEARG